MLLDLDNSIQKQTEQYALPSVRLKHYAEDIDMMKAVTAGMAERERKESFVFEIYIASLKLIRFYFGMMVESSVKHKLKLMDQRYHCLDKSVSNMNSNKFCLKN